MRFLCKVSSDVKFTTFPSTTALQRKLSLADFSPPYRFTGHAGRVTLPCCLFPFIFSFTIWDWLCGGSGFLVFLPRLLFAH